MTGRKKKGPSITNTRYLIDTVSKNPYNRDCAQVNRKFEGGGRKASDLLLNNIAVNISQREVPSCPREGRKLRKGRMQNRSTGRAGDALFESHQAP